MNEHDWPAVLAALECFLETSREEEPDAVNFHAALEKVVAEMPDEAFQ